MSSRRHIQFAVLCVLYTGTEYTIAYGPGYRFDDGICLCGGAPDWHQDCRDADKHNVFDRFIAELPPIPVNQAPINEEKISEQDESKENDVVNMDLNVVSSNERKKKNKRYRKKKKRMKLVEYDGFKGPPEIGYDKMKWRISHGKFKCKYRGKNGTVCGLSYVWKNDFYRHYQKHYIKKKNAFTCNSCGGTRSNKHGMEDHVRLCRGVHHIKSDICLKRVNDYTARARCMRSH